MQWVGEIGVVGAGQMGQGIAQVIACAGISVTLVDQNHTQLELAHTSIENSIEKLKSKDLLDTALQPIELITFTEQLNAVATCTLVIEAVTEDERLKRTIFQKLNQLCQPDTLLASNTSSIPIHRLSALIDSPERMLGLHFMNPVPLMPLVEVIQAKVTSTATLNRAIQLVEALGKTAVTVKDRPAFVLNRILLPTLNEAIRVIEEETATAEQVDNIMTLGAGFPMGPLALADMIGLDTCLNILDLMFVELKDPRYLASPLLREKVIDGQLGRKSGKGFYAYPINEPFAKTYKQ